MRKKKQNSIHNLIFLCIITTIIVTTLSFSKYQTTVTGNDVAMVAKFNIEAYGNEITELKLDSSDENMKNVNYEFNISSESEVSISYYIIVELPKEWPNTLYVELFQKDGNEKNKINAMSRDGNIYTYSNIFNISESKIVHEYILTFGLNSTLDNDKILEGIKVSVSAQQND